MTKKYLYKDMHPSELYYAMYTSLTAFAEAVDQFAKENGQYPDAIIIPEFTYRGIPIKTRKRK